ncbi:MAG: hypothetical protein AB1632_00420 [Nitrospirota bacterium]
MHIVSYMEEVFRLEERKGFEQPHTSRVVKQVPFAHDKSGAAKCNGVIIEMRIEVRMKTAEGFIAAKIIHL